MLRKTLSVLLCAAAVTFVSAQFPWEAGGEASDASSPPSEESASSSSAEEAGESSESSESSYSPPGYDPALSGSSESDESLASDTESAEAEAAPEKSKRERAAVPARAGFSTQKTCPVCRSTKIKANLFADGSDGRLHVCSASCLARVSRNPGAFEKILISRGEGTEK